MRIWLFIAGLAGASGVILGAFAAHGLSARMAPDALRIVDTGARYHLVHAPAIGLAALAMRGAALRPARLAAALFLAGIVLFSGSLYLLAWTGQPVIALITPAGGLAFIMGWLALGLAGLKLEER